MQEITLGACQACGYDGPEHVLTLDETTLWECIKCGAKMRYQSASDNTDRNVEVSDSASVTQNVGG